MSTRSIKKWALLLTFWLALRATPVHATTILAGTSPAIIEMDTNGLLDDIGTFGTGSLSLSGAGTRMIWYPGKGAFRAGGVSGTQWNDANIGAYSTALGLNTTASGAHSTALGSSTTASGSGSTALGSGATASGTYSTALGVGTASGFESAVVGSGTASGSRSTAMSGATASGSYSTAMGPGATASGSNATAAGEHITAAAFDSFVVGAVNVGGGNTTTWVSTDPLFEVANGGANIGGLVFFGDHGKSTPSDAFVVYKNGNATLNGNLTVNGSILGSTTSLALFGSSATGTDAVALGNNALASGNYGFASGSNSTASGTYAAAAGYHTTAAAYDSFVVGTYNTGGGTTGSWVSSDPLFEVGNGTSGTHSDALKVDKSGNLTAGGVITAQPGGDIPMYSGM